MAHLALETRATAWAQRTFETVSYDNLPLACLLVCARTICYKLSSPHRQFLPRCTRMGESLFASGHQKHPTSKWVETGNRATSKR